MQGARDDSVSIQARLPSGIVVRFPEHARYFYLLHKVRTGCGTYPTFYSQGAGDKAAGREADHSLPFQVSRN